MRRSKKANTSLPEVIEWMGEKFLTVPREVTLTEIANNLVDRVAAAIVDNGTDVYECAITDEMDRAVIMHHTIIRHYITKIAATRGIRAEESYGWSYRFTRST